MSKNFGRVVALDFEYEVKGGEYNLQEGDLPRVLCMVAYVLDEHLQHIVTIRLWRGEFGPEPPFDIGPDTLFVAYYASAEIGCHLALGWPVPARVLDLFTEFRRITNGLPTIAGNSLVGALTHFGLDAIPITEKKDMRDLAIELGRTGRSARQGGAIKLT